MTLCLPRKHRLKSLPAWGAWIEIRLSRQLADCTLSLPAWGAWIEINPPGLPLRCQPSLPAWGAWIEINGDIDVPLDVNVAPRMGSVD